MRQYLGAVEVGQIVIGQHHVGHEAFERRGEIGPVVDPLCGEIEPGPAQLAKSEVGKPGQVAFCQFAVARFQAGNTDRAPRLGGVEVRPAQVRLAELVRAGGLLRGRQ